MTSSSWGNIQVSTSHGSTPSYHATAPIPPPLDGADNYAGDYIGIASYGGHSYAAWMDNRTGVWQIWMARVDYNVTPLTSATNNLWVCNSITDNESYQAPDAISVANCGPVTIGSTANVTMTAGQSITLYPGFSTQPGAVFTARIAPVTGCNTPGQYSYKTGSPSIGPPDSSVVRKNINGMQIFAYPNPTTDFITVGALNNNYQNVSFSVTDIAGRSVAKYDNPNISSGDVRQTMDVGTYAGGIYVVTMQADNQKYSFKFVKE